jgi:hypothetical protein
MTRHISYAVGILAAAGFFLSPARASILGFGDFSNFTINQSDLGAAPSLNIPGDAITLINALDEVRSIYCDTPQPISTFTASFTMQATGGDPSTVYFVIQNSSLSTAQISGLTPSCEVGISDRGVTDLFINGSDTTGAISGQSTGLLSPFSGDNINVSLAYDGTTLSESLVDSTHPASYSTSYPINIPLTVGSSTAIIGLQSGNNFGSTQTFSNLEFDSVPEPTTLSVIATGGMLVLRRRKR